MINYAAALAFMALVSALMIGFFVSLQVYYAINPAYPESRGAP